MNERIREFYEQARLQAKSIDADLDRQGWMDLYHQKFAELIVKECANRATWAQDIGERDIGGEVLKHFGVRE
jgi:hypothetical protein